MAAFASIIMSSFKYNSFRNDKCFYYVLSYHPCAFEHPSKNHSANCFMWHCDRIKLRIWLSKWIW